MISEKNWTSHTKTIEDHTQPDIHHSTNSHRCICLVMPRDK